jgi:anti-sigma B factor antagonist
MSIDRAFGIQPVDGERAYKLAGPLDLSSHMALTELVEELVRSPGDITFDLSEVTFMDSSGLRVILDACRDLADQGSVRLVNPVGQVEKLLRLTDAPNALPNLEVVRSEV